MKLVTFILSAVFGVLAITEQANGGDGLGLMQCCILMGIWGEIQ